jgi:hypothetical protein
LAAAQAPAVFLAVQFFLFRFSAIPRLQFHPKTSKQLLLFVGNTAMKFLQPKRDKRSLNWKPDKQGCLDRRHFHRYRSRWT